MRRALLLALLLSGGCFEPDEPICAFACGAGGVCPDDYECRSDNYCHKKGSTEGCGFADLAVPDLAPVDATMPAD